MGTAKESIWTSMRSMPAAVWLLYVAALVNRFGNSAVVFLVFHLRTVGLSSGQAGLVLSAYGVGGLVSSMVGGSLADRYSRQGVIAGSALFACVGFLVLGQVHDYRMLLVVSVATGFMAEMYRPAANALVADLVEPARRVAAFAGYRLFTNAGFAFGPAVGGLVAQAASGRVFGIAAVCCLCYAGLVLFGVRGPATPRTVARGRAAGNALSSAVRDTRFLILLVGFFLVMFLLMQYQSTFPLFTDALGLTRSEFGLLVGLNGILVVLLSIPAATATAALRPGVAIGLGFLLTGVGFGLNAFAAGMVTLAVAVAIATMGEVVFMPHAAAYVAETAPSGMRARYMSALESAWSLSLVISPSVGIAMYEMAGRSFWLVTAGIGAGAGLVMLAVHRLPRRAVAHDDRLQLSTKSP